MRRSIERNILVSMGLLALVITTQLQMIRVFFPSVAWYLKDTIRVESSTLALPVLLVMTVGVIAVPLKRIFGLRASLLITTVGITLLRILEQIVVSPSGDLWISMLACGFFAIFLPVFIAHLRAKSAQLAGPVFAYGLFLGLALDSTIHGITNTLDLSWITGPIPVLVIIVQGLAIIGLLAMEFYPSPNALTDSRWRENLAFLALGPFLTLQTIMLQNQGWVSELSGLPGDWGFVFVLVANSLAVIGVWGGYSYQHLFQPTPSLAVAFLIPALNLILIRPGMFFIPGLLASQFLFGWSWAHMANLTAYANYKGLVRTVIMTTCGLFLFMFTAFIYYASLDLTLPIYREAILPISAAVFAVIFLGICLQGPRARTRSRLIHEPVLMVGGLCLISLLHLIFNQPAQIEDTSPKEAAIIMTYNIHSAYDVQGRQNPEAVAEVIEESEADIVALQEISRGWLVNGSTDLITWLSHRLGMHVVYKGTTGPMWGNAILSKYPILRVQHAELPSLGTPLGRGYLMAKIDIGQGRPVWIYATHLHAEQEDALVRHAQISHLLSEWGNRPYSVILGDLNAEPNDAEIKLLHTAGLVDAWTETGVGNGNTFISSSPYKRIDWIWHTPDLSAQDAWVPKTTASDHLPVVVTIIP